MAVTTTSLLAREQTHPALLQLFVQAAKGMQSRQAASVAGASEGLENIISISWCGRVTITKPLRKIDACPNGIVA